MSPQADGSSTFSRNAVKHHALGYQLKLEGKHDRCSTQNPLSCEMVYGDKRMDTGSGKKHMHVSIIINNLSLFKASVCKVYLARVD